VAYFQKFQESFEIGKLIEFKNEESKFMDGVFDGVEEVIKEEKTRRIVERESSQQNTNEKRPSGKVYYNI
jgi:hypothetical protein